MKKRVALVALIGLVGSFALPGVASASSYNLSTLISNIGFESGLAGWTYTGASVNPNTYLTDAEWAAQAYTDAQLALLYPGRPWGLNPYINHVQQTGGPVDPGGVIGAAVGNNFVGSREDGDPAAFDDRNFQLRYTVSGPFLSGDTFSVTTWGNRGRLNGDFSAVNGSSQLSFKLSGTGYTQTCAFSNWGVDGAWASQVCTFTLSASVSSLNFFVTGQNSNHDRYVAVDMGGGVPTTTLANVPEPSSLLLLGSGLFGLAAAMRRRKSAISRR